MSERHARRMLAGYREQGAAALAHGNRGRRPHNAIPPAQAAAVVELATQRYEGANHTHFTELLSEREGIDLSRPTVRRILTRAGIGSPRSRRSPQHRFRRQRMPQAGMLVQLDGSHHAWLEDRGPKFALLLAVDDATGTVVNAVFRTGEDTRGYFMLLDGLIQRWGIPLALYSDRHAVFKHNARQPETAAEATQFTRGLQELGIRQIFARSPQAKGRVERMAETFQDRLVTELRLADARTIGQATAVLRDFLPRCNARFAVQPEHPEAAYRPVSPELCLSEILCFKHTRKVAPGQHSEVPLAGPATAAGSGTSQLRRPAGGGAGTPRQRTNRPVPGPYRGHARNRRRAWAHCGPRSIPGRQALNSSALSAAWATTTSASPRNGVWPPWNRCIWTRPGSRPLPKRTSSARRRPHGGAHPRLPRRARWKAIQQARLKGLSLRAIAKELGIARDTVRKYAYAEQPPTKKLSAQEQAKLKALRKSATVAN